MPTVEVVARAEQPTAQSPTATSQPTATPTIEPVRLLATRMQSVVASTEWPVQGLDPATATAWEAFANGTGDLPQADQEHMQSFLDRWDLLQQAAEMTLVPADVDPALRVKSPAADAGNAQPILYAVAAGSETDDLERLLLLARDSEGEVAGLVEAPPIEGLTPQISADGWLVEYVDTKKGQVLLRADARELNPSRQAEQLLKRQLDEVYRKNNPYARTGIYPRYFFPVKNMGAAFYLVEESLSFQQILQINEAFKLFERPNLEPLKEAFFSANTSVLIVEQMDVAAGVTYSGTGVIELDRRDLFGNKYYLAEVLAHEGSHVLQGKMSGKGGCEQVLQREVGNKTLPAGFLEWTGEELITGVREHTIGAYHVSMWVLNQVGLRGREIDLMRQVIQTGQMNGQSLTPFCKD